MNPNRKRKRRACRWSRAAVRYARRYPWRRFATDPFRPSYGGNPWWAVVHDSVTMTTEEAKRLQAEWRAALPEAREYFARIVGTVDLGLNWYARKVTKLPPWPS